MTETVVDALRIAAGAGCLVLAVACLRVAWRLLTWNKADLIRWAHGADK